MGPVVSFVCCSPIFSPGQGIPNPEAGPIVSGRRLRPWQAVPDPRERGFPGSLSAVQLRGTPIENQSRRAGPAGLGLNGWRSPFAGRSRRNAPLYSISKKQGAAKCWPPDVELLNAER